VVFKLADHEFFGQLVFSSRRWKNWIVAWMAAGVIPTAVFGSTANSASGRAW
jgi:hypothetical protein